MADPNMTLALRIQADFKQAEQAMDGLGRQLEQTGQQAQQTNAQLGATSAAVDKLATDSAAAGAGLDQTTAASQRTAQAAAAMVAALQEQVALFGKSQDEVLRYRAAQLGAADAVEPLIKQLAELRSAQQQAAAAAQAEEQAQRQAAAATQAADGQRTAFLASLQEQADLQGKSRLEMLEYRAAQLGVTREAAGYIARLREAGEAQGKAGISAGQYQMAMRQLPMQMTDVATSLASGMPIWMVAIQQGGQIRDSFGGIGAAARAVVGTISPLAVGIAAASAGFGVLGGAVLSAISEINDLNKALLTTGSAAGMTVDGIRSLTEELAGGRHYSQAADAMMAVVSSGKLTGDTLKAVAAAAVQMSVATGEGADQIAEKLIGAKDNVGQLAAEYNAQYHFMSAATYEQIAALEDQGRKMDALKLLSTSLASEMTARNEEIRTSTRGIAAAWEDAKAALAGYWQQLKKGVTADPETFKLQVLQQQVEDAKNGFWFSDKARDAAIAPMQAEIDQIQKRQAAKAEEARQDAENQAKQQAAIEAGRELERTREQLASKAEQREKARADYLARINTIKAANPNSALVDPARVAKDLAAIDEKYKDPAPKKTPAPKAYTDDAGTRMLQQLRNQQATLQEQLGTTDKLTEAQRQQAQFAQLIADLKGKAILTAEQKSLLANQDAISAQLAQNVALDEQIRKRDELNKLTQRAAQINQSMASALESQKEQNQREQDGYGQGRQVRERIQSERGIRRQYQGFQNQLNKATPQDQLGSPEYLSASADISRGLTAALDENAAAYDRLLQKQGDWSSGASEAFANYMAEAQNIAGQTEQMVGSAMESLTQGIGDSFAQAIVYGDDLQASLSRVAQTILSEVLSALIQMGVRYAVNAVIGQTTAAAVTASSAAMAAATAAAWAPAAAAVSLATMGSNSVPAIAGMAAAQTAASGFAMAPGFATGGEITGPGTGTSDSIPAWLSNGEFVTRQAVVAQPGALPFLNDFNARGMAALDDWTTRVRHSTGGLAGVPAPSLPAPSLGNARLAEPAKAMAGATVQNAVNLYAVQDESQIASMAWGKAGEEHHLVWLQRNAQTVKSILKV